MKLFLNAFLPVALAMAVTTPLIAATPGASEYECKTRGEYNIFDDPSAPLLPSENEQKWANSQIQTAYNSVHSTDFDMTDDAFKSYSYNKKSSRRSLGEMLRGAVDSGGFAQYVFVWRANVVIDCRFCGGFDDDDAFLNSGAQEDVSTKLMGGSIHRRWELDWCDHMQQGPHLVFKQATDCKINLYDCVLHSQNPKAEEGSSNEATDSVPMIDVVHTEPVTIEDGEALIKEVAAVVAAELEHE